MIIPSSNLSKYLHGITFPLDVLEEKADRVAITVSVDEFLRLVSMGAVIGIGSRTRLKRVRLNTLTAPAQQAVKAILERSGSITTGASKEVFRESLGDGLFVWQHKANRNLSFTHDSEFCG